MPAINTATYALTTPERVKARLGILTSITGFDTVLGDMVASVTDFIETQCDRRFLQTAYSQELYDGSNVDGSPKRYLMLKNSPLTVAPTSFQYRTGGKTSPTWVDFQADTYQEQLDIGILRTVLPQGFQNIRVSYTAGYLIDWANMYDRTKHTLPLDLTDLAERLTIRLFKKREAEGKDAESFNQSSITWGDFVDERDREVMANRGTTSF